jgi:molecular chaperone GrpE
MKKEEEIQAEDLEEAVLSKKDLEKQLENDDSEKDVKEDVSEETPDEKKDDPKKENTKEDEAVLERLMRLQADFENFKKRTQKEKSDIYQFAAEPLITKLLPVMDNLERAENAIQDVDEKSKSCIEGIQMVFKQLKEALKEEGLEEIKCDCAFDPNFHHGVAVGEDDEKEDQDIMEVFQKGYNFKGKVIRPAMVKVCNK